MPWYESRWSILVSTREVEKMGTAKLFRNGRSQAVRLPKEFRFEGEELSIRREGEAVILEPLRPRTWPKGYWRRWGKASLDLDLVGRSEEHTSELQSRPHLVCRLLLEKKKHSQARSVVSYTKQTIYDST